MRTRVPWERRGWPVGTDDEGVVVSVNDDVGRAGEDGVAAAEQEGGV